MTTSEMRSSLLSRFWRCNRRQNPLPFESRDFVPAFVTAFKIPKDGFPTFSSSHNAAAAAALSYPASESLRRTLLTSACSTEEKPARRFPPSPAFQTAAHRAACPRTTSVLPP